MNLIARNYYINSGTGFSHNALNAFDAALLSAKVGNYNLVKISSILPPSVTKKDHITLPESSILYTAYSTLSCDKVGQVISSGVGLAMPNDNSLPGVIMEFSACDVKQVTRLKLQEMLEIAMFNRGIAKYTTEYCISEAITKEKYTCTFACVALW